MRFSGHRRGGEAQGPFGGCYVIGSTSARKMRTDWASIRGWDGLCPAGAIDLSLGF